MDTQTTTMTTEEPSGFNMDDEDYELEPDFRTRSGDGIGGGYRFAIQDGDGCDDYEYFEEFNSYNEDTDWP